MMKRGGAEVAPAHLKRVRRTPQWGGSRRYQALSQGGRDLPCLVKMNLPHCGRGPCCNAKEVPACGLLNVVQTAIGRVVERGRVKCA